MHSKFARKNIRFRHAPVQVLLCSFRTRSRTRLLTTAPRYWMSPLGSAYLRGIYRSQQPRYPRLGETLDSARIETWQHNIVWDIRRIRGYLWGTKVPRRLGSHCVGNYLPEARSRESLAIEAEDAASHPTLTAARGDGGCRWTLSQRYLRPSTSTAIDPLLTTPYTLCRKFL